jgi:starch-binding outer membrane protein, SusD/RagB family
MSFLNNQSLAMKRIIAIPSFILILLVGCTKVDENVFDKYSAEDFYSSPDGPNAALASVYAQVPGNWGGVGYAGADNGWYDLNAFASDEQVIPHRNTGDWQLDFARLYQRQWLPTDGIINNAWNWLYRSVYQSNLAIRYLEEAEADAALIAEARVLRGFFYYLLIDDFGSVPFYTDNSVAVNEIPQKSRAEIFDFIVQELVDNVDKLSETKGGAYYGRFNRWAGYALLAKLYLNAEVYTGTAKWDECIAACDKIINEGGFSLHSGAADASHPLGSKYYELFGDVLPEDETILAIFIRAETVGRNIFTVRSLGGTDGSAIIGSSAWNGSVVLRDYVDKFSDDDMRKRQFRYGQDPFGPQPAGFIVYDLNVSSLDNPGAGRNEGARNQKFFPVPPSAGGGASNDFPVYRYADILLMKAECLVRTNNASAAAPMMNEVRMRAGLDGLPADPTLEDIYNERGFELTWEGHRRQDMIRFGTFTKARPPFVPEVDDHFELFPIPTSALNTNPSLQQNPGY